MCSPPMNFMFSSQVGRHMDLYVGCLRQNLLCGLVQKKYIYLLKYECIATIFICWTPQPLTLFYLRYYQNAILFHFYKELYHDNIHARKVKTYFFDRKLLQYLIEINARIT